MRKARLWSGGLFCLFFAMSAGGGDVAAETARWERRPASGPAPQEALAAGVPGKFACDAPDRACAPLFVPPASEPADSMSGELDRYMAGLRLVDVSSLDTTLQVRLMYAADDNFLHEAVYRGITRAWLRPEAARMLAGANRLLKEEHPAWTLIVYDAARPLSVQRRMWRQVRGTAYTNYVGNPANGGGLHNYGMAVDVGIADESGSPLPMGTVVDYFGLEAHTDNEEELVKSGRITRQAYENRRLLRRIMRQAGFRTILYEWWHFNACTRAFAREHYPVIE